VPGGPNVARERSQLTATARLLAQVRVIRHVRGRRLVSRCTPDGADGSGRVLPAGPPRQNDGAYGTLGTRTLSAGSVPASRLEVVGIVSSTGGPPALQQVLAELPPGFPAAVLVVQHIAAGFAEGLCRWLSGTCALPVRLGRNGEAIRPGRVLVAPNDVHLVVAANRCLRLDPGPPVHHLRPCGDLLLSSLATVYGSSAVAVVLTGMGQDGLEGASAVHAAGGRVLVQDEASSTVFGMPRAVIEAAVADETLPPAALGARLRALAARR
jgi:two-component system chemotaxis response regulator CheB